MLLSFISRSHLQFAPASGATGTFEVTNLSVNPVLIGHQRLDKGEHCNAVPPVEIGFLACFTPACGPEVFIRFAFERSAEAVPNATPPVPSPFWLELSGTALQEAVLRENLCIPLAGTAIVVGRAHQQHLHVMALKESLLQWVSREHFRLEPLDGGYRLVPLSGNNMWLAREGQRTEVTRDRGPIELLPGDAVLLYTGAADGTPDGPGAAGTLQWTLWAAARDATATGAAGSDDDEAEEDDDARDDCVVNGQASGFWSLLTGGR